MDRLSHTMPLPRTTRGRVAAALFALFLVALNPPVVTAVDSTTLVAGWAPLYLWLVGWGLVAPLVLGWAAYTDAFGLTNRHVPPELTAVPARRAAADEPPDGRDPET